MTTKTARGRWSRRCRAKANKPGCRMRGGDALCRVELCSMPKKPGTVRRQRQGIAHESDSPSPLQRGGGMAMRAWKTAAVGMAGGATLGLLMLDMVYWREPHRAAVIAAVEPGKPPPRPVPREDVPAAAPAGPVPTASARPVWTRQASPARRMAAIAGRGLTARVRPVASARQETGVAAHGGAWRG